MKRLKNTIVWLIIFSFGLLQPSLYLFADTIGDSSVPKKPIEQVDTSEHALPQIGQPLEEPKPEELAGILTETIETSTEAIQGFDEAATKLFHAAGQTVVIEKTGQVFDVTKRNLNMPSNLVAGNFDRDVQPQIDPKTGSLQLVLYKNNTVIARQIIPGFRPLKGLFARDEELLSFINENDGKEYAIDMGHAYSVVFYTWLPVYEVNRAEEVSASILKEATALAYGSRGLQPPTSVSGLFKAGDLLVFDSNHNLLVERSRQDIHLQVAEQQKFLIFIKMLKSKGIKDIALALNTMKDKMQADAFKRIYEKISQAKSDAIEALPESSPAALAKRVRVNQTKATVAGGNVDLYRGREWSDSYSKLVDEAGRQLAEEKLLTSTRKSLDEGLDLNDERGYVDLTKNWEYLQGS
ncbi:MAG: hypothetical protein JWQ35_2658, partial [Bacteriovoracaceae bacterium]|nr:hypothetical protein [Bacteriovoracaceae bacterium]